MSEQKLHALVVDDDSIVSQSIKMMLPPQWRTTVVDNPNQVPGHLFFHCAFVDMHLSPGSKEPVGLNVVEKLKSHNPHLEIFAMSGDLSLDLMEAGLKAGAQRFLAKPLIKDEFLHYLAKVEALIQIRNRVNSQSLGPRWIGQSPESQQIQKTVASLKGEPGPILIEGESGTGKEVIARLLHEQDQTGPLVSVNVSAIPENLFESEFFGHVKGAFTGADQNKVGLAEAAAGGDLFLDEIEALPLGLQAKLLRFLETGEVKRVGAKESTQVHCRVICATNRNLGEMVKNNEFREDLMFRVSGKKILLPPLRERKADIPELVKHFLASDKPRRNKSFSEDGLAALKTYSWPGNVRELKRVCEQLSLTSPLPIIRGSDVQTLLHNPTSPSNQAHRSLDYSVGLTELVADFERQIIKQALDDHKSADNASTALKISRSTIYKKIKDYNLDTGD